MVGNDLISQSFLQSTSWRRVARIANKILHPQELQLWNDRENDRRSLLRIWACKEAAYKLLSSAKKVPYSWRPTDMDCSELLKFPKAWLRYQNTSIYCCLKATDRQIVAVAALHWRWFYHIRSVEVDFQCSQLSDQRKELRFKWNEICTNEDFSLLYKRHLRERPIPENENVSFSHCGMKGLISYIKEH